MICRGLYYANARRRRLFLLPLLLLHLLLHLRCHSRRNARDETSEANRKKSPVPGPDISGFLLQPFRKPKRIRTAFSPSQLLKLEHAFEKNHYVVGAERKQLAQALSLTETQVRERERERERVVRYPSRIISRRNWSETGRFLHARIY